MKDAVYKTILNSAEKLFNRFGICKTAVSEVAELADVSRATIFNNFGNKDGLIDALLKQRSEDFRSLIEEKTRRTDGTAQKIKIILMERLRLLKSLGFVADRMLRIPGRVVDEFYRELNEISVQGVRTVLLHSFIKKNRHMNIINSITFMLKGMEQGLFEHFDTFEPASVENDMDYFLKQMLLTGGDE